MPRPDAYALRRVTVVAPAARPPSVEPKGSFVVGEVFDLEAAKRRHPGKKVTPHGD